MSKTGGVSYRTTLNQVSKRIEFPGDINSDY
ncbi:hypothetical protein PCO31111_04594 [Pandoraea communis]|uniref:Uncharacterized protein n=1 Tax=Pandoraea communis TaxID=2508297 RepID=A0A5E4YJU9_9BURK|nr:hypothetical protein PCO31111_04594 [Pandoraea communis]